MEKFIRTILYFIGIICFGCQTSSQTPCNNLTENRERVNISSLVKSLTIYPLEANENYLIGNIDKLLCKDSSFLILDNKYNKAFYQFSIQGKGLKKYQNPGKGPLEYIAIKDFDILPNDQGYILLCSPMKLILLDTNFIPQKEISLKAYYNRMIYSDNHIYMYNHHDATVDMLNLEKGNIDRVFSGKSMQGNLFYPQPVFYRTCKKIYFQIPGDDCIYQIDSTVFSPYLKLDYKEKERAFNLFSSRKADQISIEELSTHPLIRILDIRDNKGLSFIYECQGFGIFRITDSIPYNNQILTGFIGNSNCITHSQENNLITWRSTISAKDSIKGVPTYLHHPHFEDPETANPVILKYDFKN